MKLKLIVTIISSLFTIILFSQEKTTTYITETNIHYYSNTEAKENSYMQDMCVLDFYYPKNIKKFPTIIWFHGGGLKSGKREIPEYLKNQGFAIIGVGYRLSPQVKGVDCIKDAAAAFAWVYNNIDTYGGDKSQIFVSGMSAGGYLTYMIGLDKKYLAAHDIDANKIAGLIPFSGHTITHFTIREEMGVKGTQPIIDEMAPLFYVRPNLPPIVIITGDRELEMLGRFEDNAYMMRMLRVAGNKNVKLYELNGSNHSQMMYPALPILAREVKAMTKVVTDN